MQVMKDFLLPFLAIVPLVMGGAFIASIFVDRMKDRQRIDLRNRRT